MLRRSCLVLLCLAFCFSSALAERKIYADQGGVCVFEADGKVGLMQTDGELLLPAEYDYITPFCGKDYAFIHADDHYGIIDRSGAFIVPCDITSFDDLQGTDLEGIEREGNLNSILLDCRSGKVIAEGPGYVAYVNQDGYICAKHYRNSVVYQSELYDLEGNCLLAAKGAIHAFSSGWAVVDRPGYKFLIDTNGNILLENMNSLYSVNDKAFYCWKEADPSAPRNEEIWHWGILRRDGSRVETQGTGYTMFYSSDPPYALRNAVLDKTGYMDESGRMILPFSYDEGFAFVDGAAVVKEGELWHLIDRQGQQVSELHWQWRWHINTELEQPIIPVGIDGSIRLIDRKGNFVNDHVFGNGKDYQAVFLAPHWLLLEAADGTYSLVSTLTGETVFQGAEDYRSNVSPFLDGDPWLWFKADGLFGQVSLADDTAGEWTFAPCIDASEVYHVAKDGWHVVLADGSSVFLDAAGQVVGPCPLPDVEDSTNGWW